MSDTSQSYEVRRPPAFDPVSDPALFTGLRTSRIFALLIDVLAMSIMTFVGYIVVAILGIFTLGLGFLLLAVIWPGVALLYVAFTLGGPYSATPGMRAMGLEMRLWHGERMYPLLAAMHAILFWVSISILTPFILLVSLFSNRKRLLHDILLGTVVINSDPLRKLA